MEWSGLLPEHQFSQPAAHVIANMLKEESFTRLSLCDDVERLLEEHTGIKIRVIATPP